MCRLGSSLEGAYLIWDQWLRQLCSIQLRFLAALVNALLVALSDVPTCRPELHPEQEAAFWWLIRLLDSGGKPFAIKGIQSVADAKRCVDIGCDGIVVSNHAGRQVDGAIGSLDALENIANGKYSSISPLNKLG